MRTTLLLTCCVVIAGCGTSSSLTTEDEVKGEGSELTQRPVAVAGGRAEVCASRVCQHQVNTFEVVVANLAYQKSVTVHLRRPDGSWVDAAASYVRTLADGRELWSATDRNPALTMCPTDIRFAAKYVVNGVEYWDNNNGQDYHLNGCGVMLTDAFPVKVEYQPWHVSYGAGGVGVILVKNLAYTKKVNAVYTTNHWGTSQVASATHSEGPNANGTERWTYQFPDAAWAAGPIEYAVSYDVAGKTFWDVSNGGNYSIATTP